MSGDKLKMDSTSPNRELLNPDHFTRIILPNINDFRKTMKYCDIIIVVDGVEFAAHKVMLAGFSPYFKTLFSGSFPESKESSIEMDSTDSSTMELILDYAYTGTIEITQSNVQSVLHAASFLQVNQLFEECCNFLENNINASNCLSIRSLAVVYSCPNLEKKSREYSLKNFLKISQEQEFLEMDALQLIDLIGNDTLRINLDEDDVKDAKNVEKLAEKCEEYVFEAVVRWLKYKEDERTAVLPEVLAQVRLAYLSPWFIFDRVETVNAIRNNPACSNLVVKALYYSLLNNRRTELQSSISRRRNNWLDVEVMLMYGKHSKTQEKSMKCIAENGNFVKDFTVPPVDFEFYVVSNYHNQCVGIHREFMWYQFTRPGCFWKPMGHNRKSRMGFGVCELDGLWFVVGGETNSGVCNEASHYNICGSWRSVAPLPVAVTQPMTVVALRGRIYVLGGSDENNLPTSLVQCYDMRHDRWSQLSPLPVIGGEFRACVIGDAIYVCRYFSTVPPEATKDSRLVYVYNAAKDEWASGPELRHLLVSGPVSFNENLVVLTKKDSDVHALERFMPSSNSWQEVATFPAHQSQYIAGPLIVNRC